MVDSEPTRWLAVEGLALRSPLTGVGRYTSHLLRALLDRHPELGLDVLVVGREELDLSLLGAAAPRVVVHRNVRLTPNLHRLMIGTVGRPRLERLFPVVERASAILWPNFVRTPHRLDVPEVVIVYDATFRSHPEDKPWWFNLGWGRLVQQALNSPARCVSISRAAADDLTRHFDVRRPLEVLFPGVPPACAPNASVEVPALPYVLAIGTASSRKNVDLVLRAHELLPVAARPGVVVVGGGHPGSPHVDVRGTVDDAELSALLSGAAALVAPSFAEGFDLPVIEALSAGIPVLASDIPVHREVLGPEWPWFFGVDDVHGLSALLGGIRTLGRVPDVDLARFDWERSALALSSWLSL